VSHPDDGGGSDGNGGRGSDYEDFSFEKGSYHSVQTGQE
jgi:hypothetical protein